MYLLLLFPTACELFFSSRVGTSCCCSIASTQFFSPVQELHRAVSIKSCNHSIVLLLLLLHLVRCMRGCKFIHFSTSSSDCNSSSSSIILMIISSKAERTRGYRANGRRRSIQTESTTLLFGCAGFVSSLYFYC